MEPTWGARVGSKDKLVKLTGRTCLGQSRWHNPRIGIKLAADKAQADYLDISVMVSPKCQTHLCPRYAPTMPESQNSPTEIGCGNTSPPVGFRHNRSQFRGTLTLFSSDCRRLLSADRYFQILAQQLARHLFGQQHQGYQFQ